MNIEEVVEWLFNEWYRISNRTKMNILDDLCSIASTDNDRKRAKHQRHLIDLVEKVREDIA